MWSFPTNIFILVIVIGLAVYTYFKWSYQYWKRKNIPQLEPKFPFGNIQNPAGPEANIGIQIRRLYNKIRVEGLKYCGIYHIANPHLLVVDPEILKIVMTKEFQNFSDRDIYVNEEVDPLTAHLFALGGQRWKTLRVKLSPTFTSGKMRQMFHTLTSTAQILEDYLIESKVENKPVDIKDILARFTTDIIGSCAFGLNCNSLKNPDDEFKYYGRKVFEPSRKRIFLSFFTVAFPKICKYLRVMQNDSNVADFYLKTVKNTLEYRIKNNVSRKDFFELLIEMNKKKELTFNEVAAQCFVFFLAGFETSSTTMTFALYELSRNPEIQEKVREEIKQVLNKHNGELTYDAVNDLLYMDQVVNETLRMYPPVPWVNRVCVKDTKIDNVLIEKGDIIDIPIMGIHYDPEHYDNPEKFDPEHFNEENKAKRHNYAHIPFGEGPRICIGMRFGLMQSKIGLTTILKNYRVTLSQKTQLPMTIDPKSFIPAVQGELYLNFERIN